MREPIAITKSGIRYKRRECDFESFSFLIKSNSIVLFNEREYPSNTAIMVPNITANAEAEIIT